MLAGLGLTSSLLSPLGSPDWGPALGLLGEDAKAGAGGGRTSVPEPERSTLGIWGVLFASLPVLQGRCCHLGEIPNHFFFFSLEFLDCFVKNPATLTVTVWPLPQLFWNPLRHHSWKEWLDFVLGVWARRPILLLLCDPLPESSLP